MKLIHIFHDWEYDVGYLLSEIVNDRRRCKEPTCRRLQERIDGKWKDLHVHA